ncbi:hypothetical protein JCM3765_007547 [Sporobolomyces pararoseus]
MSTETTNNVESTRIDYLSLLPNELLEDVFDYAYSSIPPPTLPLSKRLLPFHRKHLYRQISLSFSSRVDKFLTSISSRKEIGTAESDDSELLRFTNLRSLGLGPSCYYKDIHSALLQLPLLVDIRLGGGPISPLEFIPLIAGPTRLIHLKSIILDLNVEDRGQQILEPTDVSSDHLRMQDWTLPRASLWQREEDEYLDYQGWKHLISVAVEAGVKVEGSVHEALEAFEDYWIEKSNRTILMIYSRGFDWIEKLRAVRLEALELGVTLPSLDIDSLDQERLELVKFNQGGRDWKILSLRNREEDPLQE